MTNTVNNKRIAKNTALLYFRMILTLVVSLYTVRIVFRTLGMVDYGIYNVVAGFVTTFSFLSATTSSATQRFLSFCLGKDDREGYDKYFKNSFILFFYLSIISVLLLESVGLWFLYNKMVIPEERLDAAFWVFQSATLSLVFSFMSIPFNAVILSYEKMGIYAYISIFDAIGKLLIVFLLTIIPFDHLKVYAILSILIGFINLILYIFYSKKTRSSLSVGIHYDRVYMREILSFTGWNIFGSVSGVVRGQGLNILINLFFGPVFNTARGVAYQVYNAVNGFASNFMMAVNPQIIKTYAVNDKHNLDLLIYRGSKISFSLLTIISYPLIVLMPFILELWLGKVPPITILFTRLVLFNKLIESISLPLLTLAQATGKLKVYQIAVGTLLILNLPLSWIAFKFFHADAYVCFIILIVINCIALGLRLTILRKTAGLGISGFFNNVIAKWILLIGISTVLFLISCNLPLITIMIVTSLETVLVLPLIILYFVLDKVERESIITIIRKKILRS